jgi:alcohol dehydrogenase class IV
MALGIAGLTSIPTGSLSGTFRMPALDTLHYGSGSVTALPAELARLGVTRALVVTGRSIATGTDLVGRVRSLLGDRCAGVFADSRQHVPRSSVLAAVQAARAEGADGIVSLGGGSPIDTAKAVALCLAQDVRQEADLDPLRMRTVAGTVHRPAVAVRAVPHVSLSTTLSAAEFTGIVGITDPGGGRKDLYAADSLAPRVAFLDADLTLPTPAWLWASTGMRAVDHCVETLCSIRPHPFADALCAQALRMLAGALPATAAEHADLEARTNAQLAMWMSVSALSTVPLGLSHGIGHHLGARCDVPHGVCSAVVLPKVMDFNRAATASRQRMVAQALGLGVRHLPDAEAAAAASDRLRCLVTQLGIPDRLGAWGVTAAALPEVAAHTVDDPMSATNPVPVTDPAVVVDLLQELL